MIETISHIAFGIAVLRALLVLNGLVVMLVSKKRQVQWGRSMKIALPEPLLLLTISVSLFQFGPFAPMTGYISPVAALGSVCSIFGSVLFSWSLLANRGVGTGHYVEEGQVVVAHGPYAIVRHPLYSAAIFVWFGLALSYQDWAVLVTVFAYIIPAYYFYARDEEAMMARAFGNSYTDYSRRVPMLFPKPLAIWE